MEYIKLARSFYFRAGDPMTVSNFYLGRKYNSLSQTVTEEEVTLILLI